MHDTLNKIGRTYNNIYVRMKFIIVIDLAKDH